MRLWRSTSTNPHEPAVLAVLSCAVPRLRLSVKRVLIVSPRFVPSNAADMHRVRQALPYLSAAGWEPTVLAVDPEEVQAPQDPLLDRTVPSGVRVVRTGAIPLRLTQRVRLGNLDARSLPFLREAGARLLTEAPYDLVFFSTTALGVSVLGPLWRRRFGVPFVVDIQDPWYSEYYDQSGTPPPGGRLKYAASNAISKQLEPYVLRRAAGVVSVSPAYPRELAGRYPWFPEAEATVLPFGAPEKDFEMLRAAPVSQRNLRPGRRHHALGLRRPGGARHGVLARGLLHGAGAGAR